MKAIVFTNYLVYYLKYIILQSLLLRFFQNNKPLEYMKNAREDKAQIKLLSLQSILFDVWDHKRKRKPISYVTALLSPFPSYSFPDRKKKKELFVRLAKGLLFRTSTCIVYYTQHSTKLLYPLSLQKVLYSSFMNVALSCLNLELQTSSEIGKTCRFICCTRT
jgi:hypothetical protein